MNTKYTLSDFIKYVLRNDKNLTVKQIYEEILAMPCECPWSDNAVTPINSISSRCGKLFNNGILDREKINNNYIYWLI
jgi:hypothetical protein